MAHTNKAIQYNGKPACMDQPDLGAKDLNEINYTTFLLSTINPYDWFLATPELELWLASRASS